MIGSQLQYIPQDIEIRDLKLQIASKDQVIEDIIEEMERRIEMFVSAKDFNSAVIARQMLNIVDKHWNRDAEMEISDDSN